MPKRTVIPCSLAAKPMPLTTAVPPGTVFNTSTIILGVTTKVSRWVPLADPLILTTWEPEGTTGTVKVLATRPLSLTTNDCTTRPWNNTLTSSSP